MSEINLIQAQEEFLKYTKNFDLKVDKIKLKQKHSLRVMKISKMIAQKEGFNKTEVDLATLIGLLHDIARFKQYTEYKTFNDMKSFDHGDVGVEILEKDDYIRSFINNDEYDAIIKLSIKNHNKFAIEEHLTEEQNKFCKLIRDADKIDIFAEAIELFWNTQEEKEIMQNSTITPRIIEELEQEKSIRKENYSKIENADKIIQFLGFIFDINYHTSFEIIEKEKYVDKLVNKFKFSDGYTQKIVEQAKDHINSYIMKKIKQ